MLKFPANMATARVMLSNDDGIHSHGIRMLEEAVRSLTPDVFVVAPENEQSAAGHSLTIHQPLRIKKYDDRHISVYGTPTDCVLMGVQKIMKSGRPDMVLSGVNHGQNTGDDVTYSGTVAAAIEAALLGIPSIAFSQRYSEEAGKPDWSIPKAWIPRILQSVAGFEIERNALLNVNFPALPPGAQPKGLRVVAQGHGKPADDDIVECIDPRGRPYFWIGPPAPRDGIEGVDTDNGALNAGWITVTPLTLNLTHVAALERLKGLLT